MDKRTGEDRIFVVPNVISMLRMACIPAFIWALYVWHSPAWDERYYAAWMLAALGVSDALDGFVARHFGAVTNFGKAFDPFADRIMLAVAVFTTVSVHAVPRWLAALAVLREAIVAGTAVLLKSKGARRIDVKLLGKAGTLCMMTAFPWFLASTSDISWHRVARVLGWSFASGGIAVGYASIAAYLPEVRRALAEAHDRRREHLETARTPAS